MKISKSSSKNLLNLLKICQNSYENVKFLHKVPKFHVKIVIFHVKIC